MAGGGGGGHISGPVAATARFHRHGDDKMCPLVARSSKGDLASRTIAEISTPWVSGMLFFDKVRRLLRTAAKEKFFHLFFKEFAGVGVDRRRALFIDQHGPVGNPLLPSLTPRCRRRRAGRDRPDKGACRIPRPQCRAVRTGLFLS